MKGDIKFNSMEVYVGVCVPELHVCTRVILIKYKSPNCLKPIGLYPSGVCCEAENAGRGS